MPEKMGKAAELETNSEGRDVSPLLNTCNDMR